MFCSVSVASLEADHRLPLARHRDGVLRDVAAGTDLLQLREDPPAALPGDDAEEAGVLRRISRLELDSARAATRRESKALRSG